MKTNRPIHTISLFSIGISQAISESTGTPGDVTTADQIGTTST